MPGKRRTAAIATAGALAAALAPALLVSPAVQAAPPCGPAGYSATAHADLLTLNALNIAPLGARLSPLADVTIGDGHAVIAPTAASARADYLTATLLGIKVPDAVLFSHATQDAPPANAAPDEHSVATVKTAALRLGVGHVKASAGQPSGFTCGTASSFASVADVAVLPGPAGKSLFALPDELNGTTGTSLVTQSGKLGARAVATAGLASFSILAGTPAEVGVEVIHEPTLTGIAGGTLATSSVTYDSPILKVTLPGGTHVQLDATHTSTDITSSAFAQLAGSLLRNTSLPLVGGALGSGKVHVHLAIGDFTKTVKAHSVTGAAATLRLTVSVSTSSAVPPSLPSPPASPSPSAPESGDLLGGVGGLVNGVLGTASATSAGHLELASVPSVHTTTVLDLGIATLSVAATARGDSGSCTSDGYGSTCAPGGGCYCTTPPTATPTPTPTHPVPTPTPTRTVKASNGLPTTGGATVWFLVAGGLLLGTGMAIIRLARRRNLV